MSKRHDTDTLPLPGGAGPAGLRHGLDIDIAGFSEQGPREENQDAYTSDTFEATGVVAVADGMGGERGGRIAADTALRTLLTHAPILNLDAARRACRAADRAVTAAVSEDPVRRAGMGCALGLLALVGNRGDGPIWIAAHVGDVRILSRSPDGAVRLETRDHTPAFARWEAGEIELDAVPEAEGANRLQRAVGRGGEADTTWLPARPGWSYAIVSDGVTKAMRLDELEAAMAAPSSEVACTAIRRKVLERGPDDNFTAVVVRILYGGAVPTHTSLDLEPAMQPYPPAPRRSPAVVVIGLLALLSLLASGFALWMARETRETTADRSEVERLRLELDSLGARLRQIEEPFGPATPELPQ